MTAPARGRIVPPVGDRVVGRWTAPLSAGATDVGVAVAVGVLAIAYTAAYGEGGADFRAVDTLGYALTVVAAAALVERRRWPVPVFVLVLVATLVYIGRNYSTGGIPLALMVALTTLAAEGDVRRTVAAVVVMLASFVVVRALWVYQGDNYRRTLISPGLVIGGGIAAASLGLAVSHRREREERAERTREEEARRRVDAERIRIAREFHDIVGHSISTINVLAGVAVHVMDKRPHEAEEALRTIKETSQRALREVRAGLGVLQDRDGHDLRAPTPGLAQLELLVTTTSKAGVDTRVRVSGEPRPLPAPVDLAAYRIVQESLTNVIRHAGAESASVAVVYEDDRVIVEVENGGDGTGAPVEPGAGSGLVGMRERALALGGDFDAGGCEHGGFRVRASLPLAVET
jgi:signal transduction histidine kinase